MRILIIACQRTGGTVFGQWLAYEKNFLFINEPETNQYGDNIVVKKLWNSDMEIIQNEWDKIIGLTRDDTYDAAISSVKALTTKKWNSFYDVTNEWIEENKDLIINEEQYLKNVVNNIQKLPILQVKYENIFINKEDIKIIQSYLELKELKYDGMLDNKLRYRNNKKII